MILRSYRRGGSVVLVDNYQQSQYSVISSHSGGELVVSVEDYQ